MTTRQTRNDFPGKTARRSGPDRARTKQLKRDDRRRWLLRGLVVVVAIAAIAWALYYFMIGRWYESTDDAYVNGNIVQITPQLPGTVVSIGADDNDYVQQGQTLVKLDPSTAQVALDAAEANLAATVRKVRGLYSGVGSSRADVAVREAAVAQARADFQRRQGLAKTGAISAEELSHARDALTAAESALAGVQRQLDTSSALVENTQIASHPDVKAAAAQVRSAYLDLQRDTLVAPVTGHVAKRSVQVGQRVQPGTPLMAVVPLSQVWVDANFKETQLQYMRIGQPATLDSDLYGGDVEYHGRSKVSAWAPAARSRCCPRRTPPATGSRSCSACRCASRWIRRSWRNIRCASACR